MLLPLLPLGHVAKTSPKGHKPRFPPGWRWGCGEGSQQGAGAEISHQGHQNRRPAGGAAEGASRRAAFLFSQHPGMAKVLVPRLSGLQRSVLGLPGAPAAGFPFQKKQRAETWDTSCVFPDILQDHPHQAQPNSSSERGERSKIRGLVVSGSLWEKGQCSGSWRGARHGSGALLHQHTNARFCLPPARCNAPTSTCECGPSHAEVTQNFDSIYFC